MLASARPWRIAALAALVLSSVDASAGDAYPVTIEAVGKGRPVSVLVTSRRPMRGPPISYSNCDDGRDVSVLLWRLVAPGEAFTVTSEIRCVCFQQGHGAFPQVDLLPAQQRCEDKGGRIRVLVDTEAP